jgi:hypothetical protein
MYRVVCAALALTLAGAGVAGANGRFPASTNVHGRPGDDQTILVPVTFGLLFSADNGASFRWMCEDSIGYGGTYDPDYAITADGVIYATTFDGLKVTRDGGCHWDVVPDLDQQWVGEVEIGPDGKIWAATSSGGQPNDVFVSADGSSFTASNLFHDSAWWKSLRVAPGNPSRIYVTGYLVADTPEAMLRRSDDGGKTWTELAVDDFAFGSQPQLFVEAVSPLDPDIVFARVLGAVSPAGDAIYRSTDGGESWTNVLEMADVIGAFTMRSDGTTVIAATIGKCAGEPMDASKGCVRISTDAGLTWAPAAQQPKMACITERGDGALFACGANWEPDNFALGTSTDAASWTKLFRFTEIAGPVQCESGTVQFDVCESLQWPSIAAQFGIEPEVVDAGPDPKPPGGCGCNIAFASVLIVIPRRRRRRR